LALFLSVMAGPGPVVASPEEEIRTLLPKDAIPSINDPKFASVKEADKFMSPDEMVIGVNMNGDRRAYSVPLLSSHEIVNDVVGGRKIAVTW
jgi:hypothetical protein